MFGFSAMQWEVFSATLGNKENILYFSKNVRWKF